jgi:hypothetical protein
LGSRIEERDSSPCLCIMPKPLNRDITAGLALVVLFMVFPEWASSNPATTHCPEE